MIKPFPSDRIGRESMKTCKWDTEEEGTWYHTECKRAFSFEVGGPKENDYSFCPGCGKILKEEAAK